MPPRKSLAASFLGATPPTTLPESNKAELLDKIRHDTPTATRDLRAIKPHPSPSRILDARHVVDLARSIAVLGLIHPLVIDVEDVMIAGSHRYAALLLLAALPESRSGLLASLCKTASPAVLKALIEPTQALPPISQDLDLTRVPVRILPLSQREQPDAAWRAEVAENERRKDYSVGEVKELAARLKDQGYSFGPGRAHQGTEKALPVLRAVVGKSERQLRRLLNDEPETRPHGRIEKITSIRKNLEKVKREISDLTDADHRVLEKAITILKRIAK